MNSSGSIVRHLEEWLSSKRAILGNAGINVTEFFPGADSAAPWKASIGLVKDDILVNYTVWEQTVFQTELLVVDGKSGNALLCEEVIVERADEIEPKLNRLIDDLILRNFVKP